MIKRGIHVRDSRPNERSKRDVVTLKDVARAAGVSPITASRAFNPLQAHKVAPRTRERIFRAAQELGYRTNIPARALRQQRTYQIALVVPYISDSFLPDIVEGIQIEATKSDYSCLLYVTHYDREREYAAFKSLMRKLVDGVIWFPSVSPHPELMDLVRDLPVVQLLHKEHPGAPAVLVDQEHGAYLAAHHLIELGHQHIDALMYLDRHGGQRVKGFQRAISEAAGVTGRVHTASGSDVLDAQRAVEGLLASGFFATGLVCYSDVMAWGAMRALQTAGRRVPDDVSVIGFDNTQLSESLEPRLTTVDQSRLRIGEQAVSLLMKSLSGETCDDLVITPSLVVRSSTQAPPPAGKPGRLRPATDP